MIESGCGFEFSGSHVGTVGCESGSQVALRATPLLSTFDRLQSAFGAPIRQPITTAEFSTLMTAAGTDADLDVKELSLIVYCTGIRPEELLVLRWGEVDISKHEIYVIGDRMHEDRRVPFGSQVAAAFQARLERNPSSVDVLGSCPENMLGVVSQHLRSLSMQVLNQPVSLCTLRLAFLARWRMTGGNPGQLALITGIAPIRTKRPGGSTEPLYAAATKHQAWMESLVQIPAGSG